MSRTPHRDSVSSPDDVELRGQVRRPCVVPTGHEAGNVSHVDRDQGPARRARRDSSLPLEVSPGRRLSGQGPGGSLGPRQDMRKSQVKSLADKTRYEISVVEHPPANLDTGFPVPLMDASGPETVPLPDTVSESERVRAERERSLRPLPSRAPIGNPYVDPFSGQEWARTPFW